MKMRGGETGLGLCSLAGLWY